MPDFVWDNNLGNDTNNEFKWDESLGTDNPSKPTTQPINSMPQQQGTNTDPSFIGANIDKPVPETNTRSATPTSAAILEPKKITAEDVTIPQGERFNDKASTIFNTVTSPEVVGENLRKIEAFMAKRQQYDPVKKVDPTTWGAATLMGATLVGYQFLKPVVDVMAVGDEHSNNWKRDIDKELITIDTKLRNPETNSLQYGYAKAIEFAPQMVAGALTKASIPMMMLVEGLAGGAYESTSVYTDHTTGEKRTANLVDMAEAGTLNAMVAGIGSAAVKGWHAYKEAGGIVPLTSGKVIQDIIFAPPQDLKDMADVVRLKEYGFPMKNFLVRQADAPLGEQSISLGSYNMFDNISTSKALYKTDKRLLDFTHEVFKKMKITEDPVDMLDWRMLQNNQEIIHNNLVQLRSNYKAITQEAYRDATKVLDSVNGVQVDASDLVEAYHNIIKTSVTSVETAAKPLFKKLVDKRTIGGLSPEEIATEKNNVFKLLQAAKGEVGGLSNGNKKVALLKAKRNVKLYQLKYDKLVRAEKEIDKLPVTMNLGEMERLRQLINHKIFVPGQNVSMMDRDALRGLGELRDAIDTTMNKAYDTHKELAVAALPLQKARSMARHEADIFGLSADNTFAYDVVVKGDNKKLHTMLADPNEGLKTVKWLGKTFGADSDVYRAGLSDYLKLKVVRTAADSLSDTVESTSHVFSGKAADPAKLAAALNKFSEEDIRLVKATVGEEIGSQLNGLKRYSASYAQFSKAMHDDKYPTSLKSAIRRPLDFFVDGLSFTSRKIMLAMVGKQPLTRTLVGGMAGALEPIYNKEEGKPIDVTDIITHGIAGSIAGRFGGKIIRSALEPDIDKVVRYISQGKHIKARQAMEALGQKLDDLGGSLINKDLTLKQALHNPFEKTWGKESMTDVGMAGLGATAAAASIARGYMDEKSTTLPPSKVPDVQVTMPQPPPKKMETGVKKEELQDGNLGGFSYNLYK